MVWSSVIYRREAARLKEMAASTAYTEQARRSFLQIAAQYEILAEHSDILRADGKLFERLAEALGGAGDKPRRRA